MARGLKYGTFVNTVNILDELLIELLIVCKVGGGGHSLVKTQCTSGF